MPRKAITERDLTNLHLTDAEHPFWSESFPVEVRCSQIDDDLAAARTVAAVLMAIVTFGALLGAFGVAMAAIF